MCRGRVVSGGAVRREKKRMGLHKWQTFLNTQGSSYNVKPYKHTARPRATTDTEPGPHAHSSLYMYSTPHSPSPSGVARRCDTIQNLLKRPVLPIHNSILIVKKKEEHPYFLILKVQIMGTRVAIFEVDTPAGLAEALGAAPLTYAAYFLSIRTNW